MLFPAISIHALLAESDIRLPTALRTPHQRFLSTLSLRRATTSDKSKKSKTKFLSTLSLRRATASPKKNIACSVFLSTLSLRRATLNLPSKPIDKNISIHALLAESDNTMLHAKNSNSHNFYPRSPCGERHLGTHQYDVARQISIHALLAESDRARRASRQQPAGISIHALLAESDGFSYFYIIKVTQFLSTLSLRRAT